MKIKHLLIVFLLIVIVAIQAWSAGVVQYDVNTNHCLWVDLSANENNYAGLPGFMIFTDKTAMTVEQLKQILKTTEITYLKKSGDPGVAVMTQQEQFSVNDQITYKSRKNEQDSNKKFLKDNVAIQALIQVIAEENGKSVKQIQDRLDEIIDEKLKLKN